MRPKITANDLRFLAETADGERNNPVFLVTDGEKVEVVPLAKVNGRTVLLELDTESRGPGIAGDAQVRVQWRGQVYGGKELDRADALFVSQSAVEKFLLPYYMRFKSGAEVQALENKLFNDAAVVAAFHIPPSLTYGFRPPIVGCFKPTENSDDFRSDLV